MLWRGIISILFCMVVRSAACSQEKPLIWQVPPHFPTDLKGLRIKLVRTPCFGFCPDYSVEILGDGTVFYEGHRFVKIKGKREVHVSTDTVHELVHRFFSADYFALRPYYGDCGGDLPTAVTSIEWPGVNKKVTDCGEVPSGVTIPRALVELESVIDVAVNAQQWIGTERERMRN